MSEVKESCQKSNKMTLKGHCSFTSIRGFGMYDEYYEVNELGDIRRINGQILKSQIHKNDGRKYVCLSVNQKRKTFSVHRVVAKTFISNADNKPQVNHINGIKTDNRVENLEWCSASENIRHAFKNGLSQPNAFIKNKRKLTDQQVTEIRLLCRNGIKKKEIAETFGISPTHVTRISKHKSHHYKIQ